MLHLILNWLPFLLTTGGLTKDSAMLAQARFGIGGAFIALGQAALLDSAWRRAGILVSIMARRTADTHLSLRGRVLAAAHATRVDKRLLNSADELVATLRESFELDTPEAANLWLSICARHEALFTGTSGQVT